MEIEEFGKALVRWVRDAAVRSCDVWLQPQANSPIARRWRQTGARGAALQAVIPDAVDETVFSLLQAIDQGALRVKFVSVGGREVDLTEEGLGELAGWYMGSGGWRAMYSEQRYIDDFADLARWPPGRARNDP
jgi:hypothetical protein